MGHIEGKNRNQTRFLSLDDYVDKESMARVIDRFIDISDLKELGFKNATANELGRNSYNPNHMAKLYVYGYEHSIRSSRKLEEATKINLEVMWLMDELSPDFKTIADFRKDNTEAISRLFYEFNSFCDSCGLFGKKLVAIDGTKLKASNSRKNNYSDKKLNRNIKYHEAKIGEYLAELEAEDDMDVASELTEKIEDQKCKLKTNKRYLNQLEASEAREISTVDPDARLMSNHHGGVEPSYNIQAAVDEENHLIAAFDTTTNPTDHGQLSSMTEKTQNVLRKKEITALADKGYYGSDEFERCEEIGANPIVAPQENRGGKYSIDRFEYDNEKDQYLCPAGNILPSHSKNRAKNRTFFDKEACKVCPNREACCPGKSKFRTIRRRPNSDTLDRIASTYSENIDLYSKRQEIVEHVFGTVKRTMGGSYLLLRTEKKVKCEVALLCLGYNLKRAKCVLGVEKMMTLLDEYGEKFYKGYQQTALANFIHNSICRTLSIFTPDYLPSVQLSFHTV
jgi:transposase